MRSVTDYIGALAPLPEADFAEFGPVETKTLARYQKLTSAFLGRNWIAIPHVTHHDDLDVTECEERRLAWNAAKPNRKMTMVVLVAKALADVLGDFPQFNASVCADGATIILKKYRNIAVAVDTPQGLLVPVIRDCGAKTAEVIAAELNGLAAKARQKGLTMAEMSGSSITVSSLGHIGGTYFTPIINAPDVALLGMARAREIPARGYQGELIWKLMLPVSLSYDHRVINGADAARFVRAVGEKLSSLAFD